MGGLVFQNQGEMQWVTDLRTAEGERNIVLHPKCTKGLCYFGIGNLLTLIKVDEKWRAQFYLYNEMRSASLNSFYSIHPDVLNFFPRRVTLTKGISSAGWECIEILQSNSDPPITWSDKITHKVGFTMQYMSSTKRKWSISVELSCGAGELTKLIAQFQFSLKFEHGGRNVHTWQEVRTEAQEEEASVQVNLERKQNLYICQYRLGIGQEPVLFRRNTQFTKAKNPPDNIPLSLAA